MSGGDSLAPRAFIGTLNFSRRTNENDSLALLAAAYDMGIRGINTADSDYSGRAEIYTGRFLREIRGGDRPYLMVELSGADMGVPHDPNLTPEYLRTACERSLKRLGVDSIDRVVIPRPSWRIPLDETLAGVQDLIIGPGLAKTYGFSTFPAWLTCHGQHVCREQGYRSIASELAPYNVLDRRVENEMLPNARFWGMEFYAWAALAQGLLAGRYAQSGGLPTDSRAAVLGGIYAQRVGGGARDAASSFVQLCASFGYQPAAAALAWLVAQEGLTGFVTGPRTIAQLAPLVGFQDLVLDPQFMDGVDTINPPGSAVGDFFNSAPWMLQHA